MSHLTGAAEEMGRAASSGRDVLVRPAQLATDGDELLELITAHAVYENGTVESAGLLDRLASLIDAGRLHVVVAQTAGQLVGYASATIDVATWTGRPFGYLDCLFVDAQFRNAGFGRELFRAIESWVVGAGVTVLQWQTPQWNADAVRFYRRVGASHTDKVRFVLEQLGNPEPGGSATA